MSVKLLALKSTFEITRSLSGGQGRGIVIVEYSIERCSPAAVTKRRFQSRLPVHYILFGAEQIPPDLFTMTM